MKRTKGVNVLRAEMEKLHAELLHSIGVELQRLGRRVDIIELPYPVFNENNRGYFISLSLEAENCIYIETWFEQSAPQSEMETFAFLISNGEVSTVVLIDLLSALKEIAGADTEPPSILTPLDESISYEDGDWDNWVCVCGNHAACDGFYPCDADGNLIEPVESAGWEGLYRCSGCGRVIHQDTHKVSGINRNPYMEGEDGHEN